MMPAWMKWTFALLIGFVVIFVGFRWAGWLLTTFFILNCFVLMIVVLLQSGKAADLAGAFGGAGSQTSFGPRGAATVLSQTTTWCSVMFMVCALAMVLRTDKAVEQGSSVLQTVTQPAKSAPAKTPAPTTPLAPPPASQQPATQQPSQPPASQQPATQQPSQPPASQQSPAQTPPKKP